MNVLEQNVPPRLTSLISTLALLAFLPLLIIGVFQVISILRAFGSPANIVVRTDIQLEPIHTDFIHAFSQGGEEATDMLAPIISEIKALHPRLIRLDHLYDTYQVVNRSGSDLTFDFSRLDSAVDTILATGAKPVLSLSYMPPAIAQGGSLTNPPDDWNDWAKTVQRTIEHVSGKSEKNISGVYYEVWNEPDLAQFGGWKIGGDKNYLTLYRFAALGAQNAKNTNFFFLGGPATTGLYKNWIVPLATSGMRIDFLSWHSYLENPAKFTTDQQDLAKWLAPFTRAALLPKLITEFGFTGAKDSRYNTSYAAAHTAAVFRELSSGGPTYLFSFQLKDGPNQEDGWGLLTHERVGKRPKPRYFVYNFLDAMAGTKLEISGEGTWVKGLATVREGMIRLLLINFNHLSSRSENVPVTFAGLTGSTYTLRERMLFGYDTRFTLTATEAAVYKEVFLPANSVALLELTTIK